MIVNAYASYHSLSHSLSPVFFRLHLYPILFLFLPSLSLALNEKSPSERTNNHLRTRPSRSSYYEYLNVGSNSIIHLFCISNSLKLLSTRDSGDEWKWSAPQTFNSPITYYLSFRTVTISRLRVRSVCFFHLTCEWQCLNCGHNMFSSKCVCNSRLWWIIMAEINVTMHWMWPENV